MESSFTKAEGVNTCYARGVNMNSAGSALDPFIRTDTKNQVLCAHFDISPYKEYWFL